MLCTSVQHLVALNELHPRKIMLDSVSQGEKYHCVGNSSSTSNEWLPTFINVTRILHAISQVGQEGAIVVSEIKSTGNLDRLKVQLM